MNRLATLTCVALAVSSPALAAADEPGPPVQGSTHDDEPAWKVRQRREVLFKEGQKLIKDEKWDEAYDRFRQVQELHPHPRALYWMAYATEQLGHLLKAEALYVQTVAGAREGKIEDVERDASSRLDALSAKIPRLVVHTASVPGLSLQIDGSARDPGNGRIEVDPGEHTIVVTAPGRERFHASVVVGAGEEKIVEALLSPISPAIPAPAGEGMAATAVEEPSARTKRIAGFAVGGVGAAGLLVGTITGIVALVKHGDIQSDCPTYTYTRCPQSAVDAASKGKALTAVSTTAFAVGMAGAGVGAGLLYSSGFFGKKAAVGMTILPGGGGLVAKVGF